jgi:Tfp pilus assembly protein PilF
MCILLSAGCNSSGTGKKAREPKGLETTSTDQEKTELLKKIDRKFENSDAHFELGQLYQKDGLWTRAEYEYNTALSFEPAHRPAQAGMVKVLMASGDTAKAEIYADIYTNQVANSAAGSLRLALAFQQQGLDEYALGCYQQALRLAPNSAKINRQIGYYHLSKGNGAVAQVYLSRSFQLNPNQPDVAGELGRLGVPVRIPRKTVKGTKKLDKIVEKADEKQQ